MLKYLCTCMAVNINFDSSGCKRVILDIMIDLG